MSAELKTTELHKWHLSQDARMVDFAGWKMPILYSSIIEEHHAVRNAVGLFDIGHMGRITVTGPETVPFLDYLLTNDITQLKEGQIRYSLITDDTGGILDDVLVYRFASFYMLVVNASNREKILSWMNQHVPLTGVEIRDRTFDWFMLAIQGPCAEEILQNFISASLAEIKYYYGIETDFFGEKGIVSRTGYTGENGFEVILRKSRALSFWEQLHEQVQAKEGLAAGLGARDTLRLEAGMPLYGHEMDETMDPITAGLGFGVRLDAGDFIGKQAMMKIKHRTPAMQRIGLKLEGKRIAREGTIVYCGEQDVGIVTSGTFSPTLQKSIAMAYVSTNALPDAHPLEVEIRGKRIPAQQVPLPFYKRN